MNEGQVEEQLETVLKKRFSLSAFRLGQREIVSSILKGNDVLAIMPTGGGKSLCYQLPAMIGEGITIVVSPLIALMNDQVSALLKLGIDAGCIHSGLGTEQRREISAQTSNSPNFILYLSPERLQKPGFAQWVVKQKERLLAIDEAHCVSQWGHDFRPEYSQISKLRELCPEVPIVALTATATPHVKSDIASQLQLKDPDFHVYGFYRPNLYYQVEFCQDDEDKENFVLQALQQTPEGRIIIYCGTRKKAEAWSEFLSERQESVAFYHAGLSSSQRQEIEEDYQKGKVRILAATNAFGMGIDHADVRLVIHTQMPGNIESYYQEIGRAGRDGKPSTCLLLYSKRDKGLHSFFIQQSDAPQRIINHRWQALDAIVQYAEGGECRHADILTYFKDQQRLKSCGHCDSCSPQSERRIERREKSFQIKKKKSRKKKEALLVAELSQEAQWRVEVLREWRREYAQENDIAAFMVFSDKTLRDLAVRAPKNEEELLEVYGMGEKKVSVLGKVILEKIMG